MRIRIKLTVLATILAGLSFIIIYVVDRFKISGIRFGYELVLPVLVFSAMVMYLYADSIVKRIERLTGKIDLITQGSYEFSIAPLTDDEIGNLEKEIDKLADFNKGIIRREKQEADKIQTILSGIKEGVVVLDQLGRVILINSAVEGMLRKNQQIIEHKPLMFLVRCPRLEEFVAGILEERAEGSIEITIKEKIYTAWVKALLDEDTLVGAVLVLRDITELRRLERLRTEFVGNVSHELRTPLTSIKGFIETLLSGAGEDRELRERFLHIIQDESLRLQGIIDDLLTLSRIENRNIDLTTDRSKLSFVQNAYEKIRPVIESYAEAKGLEIKLNIPGDLSSVAMGEDLMSQVLLNLMENAVKYTSKGFVMLNCYQKEEEIVVEIRDTGCGIPRESLPRIFERFYRVDKARSRELGGTGLGLSIVKHIIEGSGGTIEVHSQEGEGSVFICKLPRSQVQ